MYRSVKVIRQMEGRWRRYALELFGDCSQNSLRGCAGVSFVDQSRISDCYAELQRVSIKVMYLDEPNHNLAERCGPAAVRVSAYRCSIVPHGIQWGGPDQCEHFKDLKLMPGCGARGERIDCRKGSLLRSALDFLDRIGSEIRRRNIRDRICLPRAWGAYRASHVGRLAGEGPEFEEACEVTGLRGRELIRQTMRRFEGLYLVPADWVGTDLGNATTVFAEMAGFPRFQVVRIEDPRTDLLGYEGASHFDLYHSRFRRRPTNLYGLHGAGDNCRKHKV